MRNYDKYKATGNDWLGKIPEQWDIRRVKDIFGLFGSGTTPAASNPNYYEDGTINWLNTSDLNNGIVTETKTKITELAKKETGIKLYPKGSFAIAMYGQGKTRGTVGLVEMEFTTNQASCIMQKPKKIDLKYLLYWFNYKYDEIRAINVGASQPNMNQDFVRLLQIHYPLLEEQTAIAQYLDIKTQAIDKKINLLTKKAETYKELRKSIINDAVCKGLDKGVKLKESEIDWIGKIPENWEVKRLKDFYSISMGNTILQEDLIENGSIPVYSATEEDKFFGFVNRANKILKENDLVIPARGNSIGFVKLVKQKSTTTQTTIACKKNKKIISSYVNFFLSGNKKVLFVFDDTAIPQFTVEDANYITILFPPLAEQTAIANYLDEKTQKIDAIVSNIGKQIDTLKELRKTLINDVVTGKIKVTEA